MMIRLGKSVAGRKLDGKTWDGFPLTRANAETNTFLA
jgi:hypothetical protein